MCQWEFFFSNGAENFHENLEVRRPTREIWPTSDINNEILLFLQRNVKHRLGKPTCLQLYVLSRRSIENFKNKLKPRAMQQHLRFTSKAAGESVAKTFAWIQSQSAQLIACLPRDLLLLSRQRPEKPDHDVCDGLNHRGRMTAEIFCEKSIQQSNESATGADELCWDSSKLGVGSNKSRVDQRSGDGRW